MRDLIDRRLSELRAELDAGSRLQAELQTRQEEVHRSMLRISGAIQVLSELTTAADERSDLAAGDPGGTAVAAPPPLRQVLQR